MFKTLLRYRLYVKLKKCEFNKEKVIFLNFNVDRNEIQMKRSRINAIVDWFEFENAKNVMIFLNFVEFYRRFVKEFSQIVTSFTNLTKNAKKRKNRFFFVMTKKIKNVFQKFQIAFTIVFIFTHYDWKTKFRMKIDVFDRETNDVLNQKNKDD